MPTKAALRVRFPSWTGKLEEPFTPGDYRATLATEMVEAGADIGSVAAFLGHRSVQTTKRFYATLATIPNPKTTIR